MNKGFTFIEVLVALLIFTFSGLAALSIVTGSVRAVKEAKEISHATWLLQNLMAQTEAKLEGQGLDKACKEKDEGKFPAPNERFQWKTSCYKIDFRLSEAAAKLQQQMASGKNADADTDEDPILKMILQVASEYLTRSTREIHVEVNWTQGKTPRQLTATSHFARYDQQPALPGGMGTGTSSPAPSQGRNP